MKPTLARERSLLAGAAPVGLALLLTVGVGLLAFVFSSAMFTNLFFLPQYVFPWEQTWNRRSPVPLGVVLDILMWGAVALAFSLLTRRMARWLAFLLGPVVVAVTVLMVHQVIPRLGLQFLVDGP